MKANLIILKNQNENDHLCWIEACENYHNKVSYKIIDLTKDNWLENLKHCEFDYILTRAPGNSSLFKQLYDERIYIISEVLHFPIYPSFEEILIYENKRMLSYWLDAKDIDHPQTHVFYNKKEAVNFAHSSKYPIVAKTNIGASGSGVKILKSRNDSIAYIKKAFNGKGISRRWWPNTTKKNILKRGFLKLKNPLLALKYYFENYKLSKMDNQKHFILLQEFVEVESEWRCVIIGDSYFGHKKEKLGVLTSGGGGIVWDSPSEKILDFLKRIKEKGNLMATSLDIFETRNNDLYVNEIQCFFGFIDPKVQMYHNNQPGRFINVNNKWQFEKGIFNENNSYNLRIEQLLAELKKGTI